MAFSLILYNGRFMATEKERQWVPELGPAGIEGAIKGEETI